MITYHHLFLTQVYYFLRNNPHGGIQSNESNKKKGCLPSVIKCKFRFGFWFVIQKKKV